MIAGSSLCFSVIWFFRKVKYSFVVFSIVESPLSAINLKCINWSLAVAKYIYSKCGGDEGKQ